MNILTVILIVVVIMLVARNRRLNDLCNYEINKTTEIVPARKAIEVEIIDEMTKEKVRNLFEEQEICNAKISYFNKVNKQYRYEIELLDKRVQKNLDDMRTQLIIQPNMNLQVLKENFNDSNHNIYAQKLRLEGMILTNEEKIVAYKKKSNEINEKITKIGEEVYKRHV